MLKDFLEQNEKAILALTERKTLELAGDHPSSDQLKQGLPTFYRQIMGVIGAAPPPGDPPPRDLDAIAQAADRGDESAMADAAGQPREAELARSAGLHGLEMLRLGYSLSHVVHAYGAMCQAITETAAEADASIEAGEFHALNRCLDVAIAGAVSDYQNRKDSEEPGLGGQRSRGLAQEMRSTLVRARTAFEAIQRGAVGPAGNTARVLNGCFARLKELIEQSLVDEGRDPAKPHSGRGN